LGSGHAVNEVADTSTGKGITVAFILPDAGKMNAGKQPVFA